MGVLFVLLSGCGTEHNRLFALEEEPNGYGMYRSGQPGDADLQEWCRLGVRQIFALNGEGGEYQAKLQVLCPTAQIVFNESQDPAVPVSQEFLKKFDDAVAAAKLDGTKILFHCSCGCHRTGRLATYYRMKYQNWTAAQALDEMYALGKHMSAHPYLREQVLALEDFVQQRQCKHDQKYCVSTAQTAASSTPSP